MMRDTCRLVKALVLGALCAGALGSAANAQVLGGGPLPRVYRLTAESTYQQGCFAPCMCPLNLESRLRGVFVVTPPQVGNITLQFEVSNVFLFATQPSTILRGSGTYRLTVSPEPTGFTGRLELDLTSNGAGPYRFDGPGVAALDGGYPPIDNTIDRNNQYCFDQVLKIVAKPISADWNSDGRFSTDDIFLYLSDWFAGVPDASFTGSGAMGVDDIFGFMGAWFDQI